MTHIPGHDPSQTLLLLEALGDYVGPENPVRFIEAFVEGLDLAVAGFARVQSKNTGRPGYAPADLLKLCICGYLNRVRSSRRLEAETHRNSSGSAACSTISGAPSIRMVSRSTFWFRPGATPTPRSASSSGFWRVCSMCPGR